MTTHPNVKGLHTIVNEFVVFGNDSAVWHFCNLFGTENEPIVIGDRTQIGSYTEIRPGTRIGNNCRLQTSLFIGERTTIGDYVFIGPGTRFMVDKFPSALKVFNRSYTIAPITIKDYAVIGGGVLLGPGVTVGKCAFIGMGSVVTRDVSDYAVVVGNPARQIGNVHDKKYATAFPEFKDL